MFLIASTFAAPALTMLKAIYVPNDKVARRRGHYGIEFKPA